MLDRLIFETLIGFAFYVA